MPDKEIMLQIRQREEQRAWTMLDLLIKSQTLGGDEADGLRDAMVFLAEDWRTTAELYERAKGKGFKTIYIEPLRHAAAQLDYVIKQLDQPRRAPLGQLQTQPESALAGALATDTSYEHVVVDAGLDEPVHRFQPSVALGDNTCIELVNRGAGPENCGRYASHPAHRLTSGPTTTGSLDQLIKDSVRKIGTTEEEIERAAGTPWLAQADDVAAYLRGETDDLPSLPPLAPSTVTDATDMTIDASVGPDFTGGEFTAAITSARELQERASMPDSTIPAVPLLGQPGNAGSGYNPAYIPPGSEPMTYAELLTPVPAATLPAHLSHSQLETLADCPTKYRAQRLAERTVPAAAVTEIPQWALIGGTAFHAIVEHVEEFWAAHPNDPFDVVTADEESGRLWSEAFDAEVQKIEASSPVPRARWRASKAGAEGETWWRASGPEMIKRYLAARPDEPTAHLPTGINALDGLPLQKPSIEIELIADVPTPYGPMPYRAVLDRVTVRPDGDGGRAPDTLGIAATLVIRDYKTGDRMPPDVSQLGEYAQLLRFLGVPREVKILGTFFNARKGTWTPEVDLEAAGYTAEWFIYRVTAAQGQKLALTTGPTPVRPSSFCGGCAVRWACPVKGVGGPRS